MLVFLVPKLEVIHGEKAILIPVMDSVAVCCNRRMVQVLSFLTVAEINVGVSTRTAGLLTSLALSHQVFFHSSSTTFSKGPKPY